MEKNDCDSNQTSDDEGEVEAKQAETNRILLSSSALTDLIPHSILLSCDAGLSNEQLLHQAMKNLHLCPRTEELAEFFKQIGADLSVWMSKPTPSEKSSYLLAALDQNVEEDLKRVNMETDALMKALSSKPKPISLKSEKPGSQSFDWLQLKTSNEMLKSKLKTKLVQTINEFKNEKKLRETMGKRLGEEDKVHLEDESFEITEEEKKKMVYEWNSEDEKLFLSNICKLKEKFNKTEFLKNCHRYKFITNSEIATLAAEDISRKLDKSNKAFLSRDFLLDKYFSTKENLTEKEMKFILKTSPLLSKCVDKAFVRAAVKNIKYEDIDKMELQIAEEIITKFETIRNLVRSSRKAYKQSKNNETKSKIMRFEQKQRDELQRNNERESLKRHKTKMIRNLNYKTPSDHNKENKEGLKKNSHEEVGEKKVSWPVPLNNAHPSTGIFIRDCSEQCNQDLNEYEKNYQARLFSGEDQGNSMKKKSAESQGSMIRFYTGGPLENYRTSFNSKGNEPKGQNSSKNILKVVCDTFKTAYYFKEITERIDNYETNEAIDSMLQQLLSPKTEKNNELGMFDQSGRTKKSTVEEEATTIGKIEFGKAATSEEAIKNKILQSKQKTKMAVYVKKLLSLAAENSFLSLRALNVKFSPAHINSKDRKGNTALFYATKHRNKDFVDYLIAQKADVNARCEKNQTPLHNAFKSGDYSLICKSMMGQPPPDLNCLDDYGKTPLAYGCRKILEMLGLESGVVSVPIQSINKPLNFDNNLLLSKGRAGEGREDELEMKVEIKRVARRSSGTLGSAMLLNL